MLTNQTHQAVLACLERCLIRHAPPKVRLLVQCTVSSGVGPRLPGAWLTPLLPARTAVPLAPSCSCRPCTTPFQHRMPDGLLLALAQLPVDELHCYILCRAFVQRCSVLQSHRNRAERVLAHAQEARRCQSRLVFSFCSAPLLQALGTLGRRPIRSGTGYCTAPSVAAFRSAHQRGVCEVRGHDGLGSSQQ